MPRSLSTKKSPGNPSTLPLPVVWGSSSIVDVSTSSYQDFQQYDGSETGMTTIAYRDGFLACDSLISMTDNLFYTEKYLITEKSVWGFAGCRGNVLLFIEWLNSGMDRKALPAIAKDDGFSAIQIDRSDLTVSVWFSPQLIAQRVNENHEAMGRGGSMARGAMGFGASAQEAVEVASHHDVYPGGQSPRDLH